MNLGTHDYTHEEIVLSRFKDFLKGFYVGNNVYKYRDQLKNHFRVNEYWVKIDLEDLDSYDEHLADKLKKSPRNLLGVFERAATQVCYEITEPHEAGFKQVQEFQVILTSIMSPTPMRKLDAKSVSKFGAVSGILVRALPTRVKAIAITYQCINCGHKVEKFPIKRDMNSHDLPYRCPNRNDRDIRYRCPLDPYYILPDENLYEATQELSLQEVFSETPEGCMPAHLQVFCDRNLCDKISPGNRVIFYGITSTKTSTNSLLRSRKAQAGIKRLYFYLVGYKIIETGLGHLTSIHYTSEEEEEFRMLASNPDCYKRIYSSIAPSIFGFDDIKRAVACLLFSGSVKKLYDNTSRRGDINILLLGDPGTAKSQILKFVQQVSPISVYTSGKGSSAAGLTASVIKRSNGSFAVEGGALILADGGVACIDEFDKMRESDRVAIHEAMEQQTISIAKAGITMTMNARCAVLAAANSAQGRWDDYRSQEENIDFMPTILSRFDMIFVIKDKHDRQMDLAKARHIVGIHAGIDTAQKNHGEDSSELSLDFLKKYIAYCRSKVGPRVSEAASRALIEKYVEMRNGPSFQTNNSNNSAAIPMTVRQLEGTVRIAEALAKMELKPFADETHVKEALRLFEVSTLKAAASGNLAGAEGFATKEDLDMMTTIEKKIKRRLSYGLIINEDRLHEELADEGYSLHFVKLVISKLCQQNVLTRRGVSRGKLVCCSRG